MSRKPEWIHEKQAAEKLGYTPKYFRHQVKKGKLMVAFTNINGRAFQYDEKDIDRLLLQNSTVIDFKNTR